MPTSNHSSTPNVDQTPGGVVRHTSSGVNRAVPYNATQRRSTSLTPAGGSPLIPGSRSLPLTPVDSPGMNAWHTQSSQRPDARQQDLAFFATTNSQPLLHMTGETDDPLDTIYPMNVVQPSSSRTTHGHGVPQQVPLQIQLPPPSSSNSALTISEMEGLLDKYDLQSQRNKVYAFQKRSIDDKLTIIFMQQMHADAKLAIMSSSLTRVDDRLAHLEKLCELGWTPNKPQYKLLRALTRHYIIKALPTYSALANYVKNYVHNNADILHMSFYNTDPPVRTTVNDICVDIAGHIKSDFRKALFKAMGRKTSLSAFASMTYKKYHLAPVPTEIPTHILATFALMRQVAEPLYKKKNAAGNDTGFWKDLEKALDSAYKENSPDKDRVNGPKWQAWALKIIADDKGKWPSYQDAMLLPDGTAEIDNALGITRDYDNDVGISGGSADLSMQDPIAQPPQPEKSQSDDEGDDLMTDAYSAELARRAEGEPQPEPEAVIE